MEWKRIAGIHLTSDNTLGAVWLGHDVLDGTIHIMDCCVFRHEVPVVIAEGLNVRGRWIPIAWGRGDKDMADELLDRGCRILRDPVDDSKTARDMQNRNFLELLRTKRIKTNPRMAEWNDDYRGFKDSAGDGEAYPLICATRNAIAQLDCALRQKPTVSKPAYPKVATI